MAGCDAANISAGAAKAELQNTMYPFRPAVVAPRQWEHVTLWRLFVKLTDQLDIETLQGSGGGGWGLQRGPCGDVCINVSMACS